MHQTLLAETVRLQSAEGSWIDAYCARPLGPGPFPAVVIIHHAPGLDEETLDVARRLAARGYLAVAPHLYTRETRGLADPSEVAMAIRAAGGLSDLQMLADMDGTLQWLHALPTMSGRAAVLGFCSGGRQAYLAACRLPFDAAVDCYGGSVVVEDEGKITPTRPVAPIDLTESLHCPVLGIFGADDRHVPLAHIEAVAARAEAAGKQFEYHVYDGAPHAFLGHYHASYRVEAANAAWDEIFRFLERHLAGERVQAPASTRHFSDHDHGVHDRADAHTH